MSAKKEKETETKVKREETVRNRNEVIDLECYNKSNIYNNELVSCCREENVLVGERILPFEYVAPELTWWYCIYIR